LKMYFPCFDGENPRIWKDKCFDYFKLFNVNPSLWLVSATLHMDGNATLWLKAYRLRHEISTWPMLMTAVMEKFGADDYRCYLKQFLALKQKGSLRSINCSLKLCLIRCLFKTLTMTSISLSHSLLRASNLTCGEQWRHKCQTRLKEQFY
jgi:ABC-type uncharacterized transport system permease subunit